MFMYCSGAHPMPRTLQDDAGVWLGGFGTKLPRSTLACAPPASERERSVLLTLFRHHCIAELHVSKCTTRTAEFSSICSESCCVEERQCRWSEDR